MTVEHEGLTFERLGHASLRIKTDDGTVLYVDPWSDVVDGSPGDADAVFVTHGDFDHYDPEAIDAVSNEATTVAVYEAVNTDVLDRPVMTLTRDETRTVAGVTVTTVPAYNRADGDHVDDDGDPFHAEGEGVGLVLSIAGTTVYVASDTDFLDEHADRSADVFIPPIGGHYTMDRHEAADFARSVDPVLVLPVHYDTFEPITTDAEAFARELEDDGITVELF